jgi:hypothetical protein
MNDVLAGLLKNVAPMLATAVTGPLGGMAVKAIAEKLGVEDTVEAVTQAIQADPEAAQKLAEIDVKKFELHNANTDSARKMNAEIQNSSVASVLAKNVAYVIDIMIVGGALFMTFIIFFKGVPDANKALAYTALGSLWTLAGTVLNFHRGSSQGSKDKADEIQKLKDMK